MINKRLNKVRDLFMRVVCMTATTLMTTTAFADDKGADPFSDFLQTKLQALFGSSSGFWKMFILADIAMATVAAVKTKNPMAFIGVFGTALIPGFLINMYVFPSGGAV